MPRRRGALATMLMAAVVMAASSSLRVGAQATGGGPLALASALFGGAGGGEAAASSNSGNSRAVADAVWGALSSGSDDARARVLLASLLGLDPATTTTTTEETTTPGSSNNGRALLGFAVEEGMAPLSRFSATMQDIVTPKGYPLEEHKVTTDDGFVLTMHRIPAGRYRHTELPHGVLPSTLAAASPSDAAALPNPKPAVLLHHGITLSSASFAVLNANESLAYVLADAGFDVWMANSRGNTFSWEHEDGPQAMRDPRYWQKTSMDDLALKDLPAQLDAALAISKTKRAAFVGHSQGCTLLLALLAEKPEYNDKVTVGAQMGPVTFVKELQAPFLRGGVINKVDQVLKRLAWVDPMPTRVTAPVLAGACRKWPTGGSCAKGMAYSFYGPSVHMTPDDYVEVGAVWPAGVASRNLEHWAQMMRREGEPKLTKYDFGTNCTQRESALRGDAHPFFESCNQAEYGKDVLTPPEYDLTKVTAPLALFEGALDVLATSADVELLKKAVGKDVIVYEKLYPTYNHVDFVFARNALHKGDLTEVLMRYAPRSFF